MAESEWMIEKRELCAAAQDVLGKAFDECLARASSALDDGDQDGAAHNLVLASIAANVESRTEVVRLIEAGFDEMTQKWAELAKYVANKTMSVEEANSIVHEKVASVLALGISQVTWPGLLTSEEVHMLSGLAEWLLADDDDTLMIDDEDDD